MKGADAWRVADPCECASCGREACEDHVPTPKQPIAAAATAHLVFSTANDMINAPRPVEIIEGVAWADSLTVLVSESGTGKTFVLLDMSAAVSSGVPWRGRDVNQGSVAYLSYEGDALGLRLRALREKTNYRLDHLHVLRPHDPLSPRAGRDGEEASIGEVGVVAALEELTAKLVASDRPPITFMVIDTVRASLSGSEDSSEHGAAYLRAVRRIMARVPGAATIMAHHAGWQDGDSRRKRERGSSAWRGNCDATFYLEGGTYDRERGEGQLTLQTLKVRDAEGLAPLHLVRRRVELLEVDRHGLPVTSCLIDQDRRTREDREADSVASEAAAKREVDLRVLRAMRDYPATSIASLRSYVSGRTEDVSEAVARILRANHALVGTRGKPYTLTAAGVACLNGANL